MIFLRGMVMICTLTMGLYLIGCDPPDVQIGSQCDTIKSLPPADNIAFVGDSFFDYNKLLCEDIGSQLSKLQGKNIKNNAISGANFTGGILFTGIDQQFQNVVAERGAGVVDTLILNGGVNDIIMNPILLADCLVLGCPGFVEEIISEAYDLVDLAHDLGVDRVLYVGYDVGDFGAGVLLKNLLNTFMDRLQNEQNSMGIEFLDVRGMYEFGDYWIDNHPTAAGSKKYAERIHDKMNSLGW